MNQIYSIICDLDRVIWLDDKRWGGAATYLGNLVDWWLLFAHRRFIEPRELHRSSAESLLFSPSCSDEAISTLQCHSWGLTELDELADRYRSLRKTHEVGFGAVGDDLSYDDLCAREQIGFALKPIETEDEGVDAWRRCVLHALFEDEYGISAMAHRCENVMWENLYANEGAVESRRKRIELVISACELRLRELTERLATPPWSPEGAVLPAGVKLKQKLDNVKGVDKDGTRNIQFLLDRAKVCIGDYVEVIEKFPQDGPMFLHEVAWLVPDFQTHAAEWKSIVRDLKRLPEIRNCCAHPNKHGRLKEDDFTFVRELLRLLNGALLRTYLVTGSEETNR